MIAVDTNVVVRMIAGDDEEQLAKLEARLLEGFFISHGVLMETEWVLRSAYRLKREDIHAALVNLARLDQVRFPDSILIGWALDQYGKGADLADMLHLIDGRGTSGFLTFDKALAQAAASDSLLAVELLS